MKVKPGIPQLHTKNSDHGSSVSSSDYEKAEALLNHFSSVFTLEPDGDAPLPPDQHVSSPLDSMVITEELILEVNTAGHNF